ncbi:thermonuclease family protein [Aminobacter sp. MET-1]|uniref:thermonuclease family protein n=1 Tax=Aminobacter sp. MET-1 TaxID=2951085 RepID=UPI00226AD627|nr:thermonuclease family protein [Aminobacter sp. MET-1]MCX8571110.1 thermonuclease family protein [Aminobacter sp. MET-1]MCX8573221.1 thermonuclease family protein [Aminobacter sp. MET-1]
MSKITLSIISLALLAPAPALAQSGSFPLCSYGKRSQCVVDGDTFWHGGEKYRLKDIDAPEIAGGAKCQHEYQTGVAAAYKLQAMLESGIVSMTPFGQDRYKRKLVAVLTNQGDISKALIDAKLAQPYGRGASRASWC